MRYPITVGEVAFVKTTDEPVLVKAIDGESVDARRRLDNGDYHTEKFGLDELLSEKARLMKELEYTTFSLEQREKAQEAFEAKRTKASPIKSSEVLLN